MPAGADIEAIIAVLGDRMVEADPALAGALELRRGSAVDLPRLEVASHPPRRLAVVAASERALAPLVGHRRAERLADRRGERRGRWTRWRCRRLLLEASVRGVLVGAGDPPAADERRALGELTALVAAVAERRPELVVVLAGGMTDHLAAFGDVGRRPGEVVLGPAAQKGVPGGPLAELLLELALPPDDAHRSLGSGAMALAEVLDRRVDVVEIGYDAGTRAAAAPGVGGGPGDGRPGRRPDARPRARRPRRRGRRPGRGMVDLGRRPAPAARPPARAADRAVGRRDRRRRHAPAGRRPRGPRRGWPSATPDWDDRPPADLVVAAGGAWAVAARTDRGPRPRRRAAPAGRRPVRARPRAAPGAARLDPRRRRATGDGRRPRGRPARPARARS